MPLPPIFVANLFAPLCGKLHVLLRSLSIEEWHLPTSSSERCVKDIASHLLDGSLRRLSMQRDQYLSPDTKTMRRQGEPLLNFLNRLNAEWEVATRRLSPGVIVGMMESADTQVAEFFCKLDPFGPAIFPVAWAGEQQSLNWMDIGRDLTEKWHHTQQIFDATGRQTTITDPELFHPCLDIFLRALPNAYRHAKGKLRDGVTVKLFGAAGGAWHLTYCEDGWRQTLEPAENLRATIQLEPLTFWRLVTKRRTLQAAREAFPEIQIDGDNELGRYFLEMVSMMA